MATKIRITTVTCSKCAVEIYSRARHDYHACYCGHTQVYGGFDYPKYGWNPADKKPTTRIRYIAVTRRELYDDWNTGLDKYGFFTKKVA